MLKEWVLAPALKLDFERERFILRPFIGGPPWIRAYQRAVADAWTFRVSTTWKEIIKLISWVPVGSA